MKPVIYASKSYEITERERKNTSLARRICSEGIVLLENNGILPLKPSKIALYGAGARHTVFGGTGSGENNPRYNINVEDGLKNAGFIITSTAWLDEYDLIYNEDFSVYKAALAKRMRKIPVSERMDFSADNPFYLPSGHIVNSKDKYTDTAFFILSRQSGEGADRKDIPGDYYITEDEKAVMRSICQAYKDTILIINAGAVIDLTFLDEISFSAVLLLMQGGMESGNGLADIITGKANPSGRLADTWGASYNDYPSAETFSERSAVQYQEDYKEGIFVGYRWFEKMNIRPRYPFGYGLSYTDFRVDYKSISNSGTKITVKASVTNTGAVSGRNVIMLYISCPENRLTREVRSLAAFCKSSLLESGTTETVALTFDLTDIAGFDNEAHEFILEKGSYILYLSDKPVCIIELDIDVITEKNKPIFTSDRDIGMISFKKSDQVLPDLPRMHFDTSLISTITHDYSVPEFEKNNDINKIASNLNLNDMCHLLVGRTFLGPYRHRVFGAVGYTTSRLYKKGIDGMPMADGPQGLNLTRISKKPSHNLFAIPTLPAALRDTHKLSKIGTAVYENPHKYLYYQHCTSWPSETMVCQTWDVELARLQGEAIGNEMKEFGVVFWLAPAVNIHRNPLCGRNYEYYSEDPLLTGKMASAVTTGVQSRHGCFATVKHFAANNLETKRNLSSSNLDERTLREIYLKAFRICIREANIRSVMCSYNKINGIYTALNYGLETEILRNEWHFDGIVMTDWFATGHHESLDELCAKAGTDLIMPGLPNIPSKIKKAYKKGLITKEDIERSARRIIKLALESHASNN